MMYPPHFHAMLVLSSIRRLTQSLLLLCPLFCWLCWLALWLLPVPLVRAQTGASPQAAAQVQPEARARELERQLNFPLRVPFLSQRSEPVARELVLGQPIEAALAGGEQHTYSITLSA